MKKFILFALFILFFPSSLLGKTLEDVRERGHLNCGVSEGQIGFSDIDSQGEWIGFDVEFCRAVALAIFGDSKKVKFVSTTSRSRFPILASKKIDILSRSTTWTFSRDTNLRFEFVGIIFYDGQGFIVPKSLKYTEFFSNMDFTFFRSFYSISIKYLP